MRIFKWALGGLAVLLVTGAVVYGVAGRSGSAQAADPNDPSTTAAASRYEELLAQKLGISVDTLKAAQTGALDQMIDEAVTAGKLTPDQATKLKAMDPGQVRRHVFARIGGRVKNAVGNVIDAAAKTIGISSDDVKTGLKGGQSLAQIASSHNVTRDQLKTGMTTDIQAQLATAVSSGKLTQQQSDAIAKGLSDRLDKIIDRTGGQGSKGIKGGQKAQ